MLILFFAWEKQTTVIPSCQENIPLEWKFHAENNTFLIAVLDIDQFRSIQSMSSGKVFTKFKLTLEAFAFIHAPTPLCHQYPLTQTKVLPRSMMQTSNIYWSWLKLLYLLGMVCKTWECKFHPTMSLIDLVWSGKDTQHYILLTILLWHGINRLSKLHFVIWRNFNCLGLLSQTP